MGHPDRRDIIMYSTTWCGDCALSRRVLAREKVLFVEKIIDTDPEAEQEFTAIIGDGPRSIPRILFRQNDRSTGEMVTIDTLVEPTPVTLINVLRKHGYIKYEGE